MWTTFWNETKTFWLAICRWIKGLKTLIFSLAVVIWGVLEVFDWNLISPENAGFLFLSIGIIGAILRFYTDGPIRGRRRRE